MKKKTTLLKSLFMAAALLVGANTAWAGDKTVVKYSFDDATSPSLTAGSRVTLDYSHTSVITKTAFLNATNNVNGDPGSSTVSLGSEDLSSETWTLSFEWAANGGCNSKTGHTTLKAGDTNLFDVVDASNWNTNVTVNYGTDGSATIPVPGCNKSNRFTIKTADLYNTTEYWHHFVITGNSEGVKMTVTNSSTGTIVIDNVTLSATNVSPTSLIIEPSCGGAIGIDELSLSYFVEGEVIQTPVANYTAVDGINRTITATCETEGVTIRYSTDGENYTDGASVTVSESGNVYFKAVKGTSESDVLTFAAVAGEAITLNTPVIDRTSNTSVTISADQTSILLSPTATIYYEYGTESGSFTGSKTLTVAADAIITAYAEATGYTTSVTAERAVALFPENVETIENTPAKTSGWSTNAFSAETKTVSERTYAALMLTSGEGDDATTTQWGKNIYLQTNGAWGFRASGNWYINSDKEKSWILLSDLKTGDIVVVNVSYGASDMVNATYSKYSYGTNNTYEVTADGNVELAFNKPNASTMDYIYGVYVYRTVSSVKATIGEAGYATYVTAYASDFSASGLKAYTVTSTDGAITLADVTNVIVPANTGLILAGDAKEYEINTAIASESIGTNLLKATTAEYTAKEGDYVLANGAKGIGFYPAKPSKAAVAADPENGIEAQDAVEGLKIPAGKAYLHIASAAPEFLPFAFGAEATGVKAIATQQANGAIFNLAGQRVAQPTKGLYIVGGKKVVIK